MALSHVGVALFAVATLGRSGQWVLGIRHEGQPHSAVEVDGDVMPLIQTSNVLVRGRARPSEGEVHVVARRPVSRASESFEGGFGEEADDDEAARRPTGVGSEGMAAYMPLDLGKISASSARQLDDLYLTINRQVNPELLQELRERTPKLMQDLRIKGHLHYPHMHVVNHRVVPASRKSELSASAFATRHSFFSDDRVVLVLVCFALVSMSSFFNFRRQKKGTQGMAVSRDLTHVVQVDSSTDEKKLSVMDGTIDTLSGICGMGFLSLPYAMSQAGWVGAPLIVFFAVCAGYTAQLLTRSLQQEMHRAKLENRKVIPGWGFLLGAAFGPKAERFVNLFLVVELWGYFLSGVVATALNLNQLIDEISISAAIGLTVLVQFVLTAVPMRTLTRLNVLSNFAFFGCAAMFVITGLMLPAKAPATDFKMVKAEGVLAACGIIVFSPAAHSLYPSIMQRMERPELYSTCITRAYTIAVTAYLAFAVSGYYLFGDAVQTSAVKNIGADLRLVALPNLGWMNYVAAACMVTKMSGLQPLILTPLSSTLESMLHGRAPEPLLQTFVAPAVLTVSAVVATHFANQMAALLNLVGSILCMSIAFVLPVLCFWKLSRDEVQAPQKMLFAGLIMMGSTFAVLGLITALDS